MERCVIWGVGNDYETTINQVKFEELKGNMEVVALVTTKDRYYGETRDGYPLVRKNELQDLGYDYIIVVNTDHMEKIMEDIDALGIDRRKVINGKVFRMPMFDFKRYISLVKDPVTILSDDCWGGFIYHDLCLPFISPTVNIAWPIDHFCKFMLDPFYYLEQPLRVKQEGDFDRGGHYPIGILGEGNRQVELNLVHAPSFTYMKERWDRRKERVNPNRVFVKLTLNDNRFIERAPRDSKWSIEKSLEAFEKVQQPKICFYCGESGQKDVVFLKRFKAEMYQAKRPSFDYGGYVRLHRNMDIDILKLLNGEPDYMRQV